MNQMRNFFNGAASMMNAMGAMGNAAGMSNANGLGGLFGNMSNLMNMFNQFKNNLIGALMSMGYNIPQNIQGNPEAIVNYLKNSGQMSEQQFNQLSNFAHQFQNGMNGRF